MPAVSAIILAAGESTRMGTQKALLSWEGTTLIEYELAQLGSIDDVSEIIVVTGHQPERITAIVESSPRARAVRNDAYRTGKVSSITTGTGAVSTQADAIMLCAVDQPRPAHVMQQLIDTHFTRHALITLPAHRGHRGHPVIFDAALRPDLTAIREETHGIREIMVRHDADIATAEFDDPVVLLDLNTPADLRAV